MITDVGSWVIQTACGQIAQWIRTRIGPVQVSVNVAARQFDGCYLDDIIMEALDDNGIDASLLELELTESSLMADTERTIHRLGKLQARGVQISVDDFGTGYSSLAYLRRFPIDKLKIDRAFVTDIGSDDDRGIIALTIIRMAHSLHLAVVAEGVETAAEVTFLRVHGCEQAQGYYFSHPLPVEQVERVLREDRLKASGITAHPNASVANGGHLPEPVLVVPAADGYLEPVLHRAEER